MTTKAELARKILTYLGYATSPSNEPGADHRVDAIAEMLSVTTTPPESQLREALSEGCTPTDIAVLRKANIDLANESRRYQSALEEVQQLFRIWEGGLDEMDGEEYQRACNEWDRVEKLVDKALSTQPQDREG